MNGKAESDRKKHSLTGMRDTMLIDVKKINNIQDVIL